MKGIIVDDEAFMVRSFMRQSAGIADLEVIGQFTSSLEAYEFAKENTIDIAFLDIHMPRMSGLELAEKLREIRPDMLIVFISAHTEYVAETNDIGADYLIVKPYKRELLEQTMVRMRLLASRQRKSVFVRTFGTFTVFKDDVPLPLQGRAKEILAYAVTYRGKEVSNREVYRMLWEERAFQGGSMNVYYNAVKRLRGVLVAAGIDDMLISTGSGLKVDVSKFDCDFYAFLNGDRKNSGFKGEFMSEYSWGEYFIGPLLKYY